MEYLLAVLYVPISCVCITTVAVSAADPRAAETASGGYTPDWGRQDLPCGLREEDDQPAQPGTHQEEPTASMRAPRAEEGGRFPFAGRDTARLLLPQYLRLTRARAEGVCQRARRSGYHYCYCGENIGRSSGSEETPENVLYQ